MSEEQNLIKVKNVADDFEARTVIDLLRKNSIPCIKREREAGEYLKISMGYSVFGADIYVDEKDYDAAVELINGIPSRDTAAKEDEDEPIRQTVRYKARKIFVSIWLILIILGIIFSLFGNTASIF
jgi:hypothetical protein